MKNLPYFRWYPADADTDENFRAMDDADIGFYVRCLNHAWINGGIPADPKERARVLHTRLDIANKRWERVGKCFVPASSLVSKVEVPAREHGGNLLNPRQESERDSAMAKSLKAAESANHRYERICERTANAPRQARARANSDSLSCVVALRGSPEGEQPKPVAHVPEPANRTAIAATIEARFEEWIRPWPRDPAPERSLHAFVFCWSQEEDAAMFACRDRFLASKDAAEGVCQNPERFLNEQKQNRWQGKWPPARMGPTKVTGQQAMLDLMAKRVANGRSPL